MDAREEARRIAPPLSYGMLCDEIEQAIHAARREGWEAGRDAAAGYAMMEARVAALRAALEEIRDLTCTDHDEAGKIAERALAAGAGT
jgi:hypothetical protein